MRVQSMAEVLLATADRELGMRVSLVLKPQGLTVGTVDSGEAALRKLRVMRAPGVVLLDSQMAGAAGGELLAAMAEAGVRKRFAVGLIAGPSPDERMEEWVARMREGIVDDVVPRNADAAEWLMHLNRMQRGHDLCRELEDLREAALVRAQYDRLTGTLNREAMMAVLFRETDRVQRLQGALGLVLLDLDDFGHWNSELGMEVCDQLLRGVAKRVGKLLRSYDLLGRVGKDEFLLALPGCSPVNAAMMAERLRMEVFGVTFPVETTKAGGEPEVLQVRLSACYGIASSNGRSPVVVLREAELALALAKQLGPDSIRCSGARYMREEMSELLGFAEPDLAAW
jgi:diguanylate cyclase (GGDEF)-like protein